MKVQYAVASGHLGIAIFGKQVAESLPRDTGEWLAILNSASGGSTQDIALVQDELVDRVALHETRAAIEQVLLSTVDPALSELSDRAEALFGAEFQGITKSCEYDPELRECLIRARLCISSASPPEVLYERYQQLIADVAVARNSAGVGNLDVDIRID